MQMIAGILAAAGWAGLASPAEGPVRYDGHKVVRVEISGARDLQAMLRLSDDVWSERIDVGPADFRLPPEGMAALAASGLRHEVLIEDVQALIDEERARLARATEGAGWFDDFKDLAGIEARMEALAAQRPDLARTITIGTSIEGRPIRGLRISRDGPLTDPYKPGLVFLSTQHAREWIAPMVTMYFAEALVTRYDTDPAIQEVVDRGEVYVVPVANPDGYVYTWATDRLWRKNRRDVVGSSCFGVDLNRNWGYQWGLPNGSSGDPCSGTYRGTASFSEPETAALRDFVLARPGVRYVHDMHSYGQLLLYPWGYTGALPPRNEVYAGLGATMRQLIQGVHGRVYPYGPSYTTLYPVSGGAKDWAWGARRAFTFSFELRGTGFVLPPAEIVPNSEEVFPALLHLAQFVLGV
jgi:murein tripeptide amidase MpaA